MRPHDNIVMMWIAMFRTLFSDAYRVRQLIADLADDDLETASEAAEDLGEAGDPYAVPALLAALAMTADEPTPTDPHEAASWVDFRQDIVRALGKLKDPRAKDMLADAAVNDPDAGVRYEAQIALSKLNNYSTSTGSMST